MKPRNLFMLFRQDLAVALRNSLVWFMLFTALLMIVMVRFAIPADFELEQAMFWHDATQEQQMAAVIRQKGQGDLLLPSPSAVEEAVAEDRGAVGVIYSGNAAKLVTNGDISPERLNLIQATLEQMQAAITGAARPEIAVETLRPRTEAIPRNLSAVPMLLTFEVLITGFLLVAVMIFQEKQEGSIRAFRISPGTVTGYILAKTTVFTLLGLVYGSILVLATIGVPANWGPLLGVMAIGAILYILMGIAVAVFFNNLSEWFIPGLTVLILNFLPIISYALPTFSPRILTWIPSYYAVFAMGEVLFPTGARLTPMLVYYAVGIVIAFALCYILVTKKLMKEGNR